MRPKPNRDVALLPNNVLLNLQNATLVLSAVTAFLNDARYKCGAAYVSVVKKLLLFTPFTLHLFAWNPDKHRRLERWRVALTLHHPSPSNGYKCKTLIYSGINTEPQSRKSIHPIKKVKGGWRVISTLHPPNYLSFSRLHPKGEGWRVFEKILSHSFECEEKNPVS